MCNWNAKIGRELKGVVSTSLLFSSNVFTMTCVQSFHEWLMGFNRGGKSDLSLSFVLLSNVLGDVLAMMHKRFLGVFPI
jgi:hypothetical protein